MTTYTPEQIARIRESAEEMGSEGHRRYEGSGFDWEDFIGDLEKDLGFDLPDQMDDPLVLRIERWARAAWNEANV